MKRVLLLGALLLFAQPAFGQEVLELTQEFIVEEATSSFEIATTTATSTVVIEEELLPRNIVEKIEIIPGGLVLEVKADLPVSVPVINSSSTSQLAYGVNGEEPFDNELFNLIYEGFEEFVFKVFGW